MLHPMVYDWTEGLILTSMSKRKPRVPNVLGAGESVEFVTNYSLANDNDRVIGISWEEASLFRRKPATMGVKYRLSDDVKGLWNAPPVERWKRTGPFAIRGWQRTDEPPGTLVKRPESYSIKDVFRSEHCDKWSERLGEEGPRTSKTHF